MLSARTTLGVAVVAIVCAVVGYQLTAHVAGAHNQWEGEARKWPWRAGIDYELGTLQYVANHTGQEAIDVLMANAPVHAAEPGTVTGWSNDPTTCPGMLIRIRGPGGKEISYIHLKEAPYASLGQQVVQGQFIGKSGNTGSCSRGLHLHFELLGGAFHEMEPISHHGIPYDPLPDGEPYRSDAAGIGDVCDTAAQGPGWSCTESSPIQSFHYSPFVAVYNAQGGYNGPGVTWDPCGNEDCWWVHNWSNGLTGQTGVVQDVKGDVWAGDGVLARRKSSLGFWDGNAFWMHGAIWDKYLALGGAPYSPLGYPVSNETGGANSYSGTPYIFTWLENGMIIMHATWPAAGPYETHGAIWSRYYSSGGPWGSPCGLPTSDVLPWLGGSIQTYELGYILQAPGGAITSDCA